MPHARRLGRHQPLKRRLPADIGLLFSGLHQRSRFRGRFFVSAPPLISGSFSERPTTMGASLGRDVTEKD